MIKEAVEPCGGDDRIEDLAPFCKARLEVRIVAPRPVLHVDELKNRLPPPGMTGRYPDLVNDEKRRPPQKADRALGACATHPSSLSPSIAETSSGSSMAPSANP